MKLLKLLPFFLLVLCISSCEIIDFDNPEPVGTVEGVRPIYASNENWDVVSSQEPRPIEDLGKIYYKDDVIYVNERNKGIHVIDNSNPENPVPIRFIEVIGSEDIAIKGNTLYVDNITDLLAIDISNLLEIEVTSRVKDLYSEAKKTFPEGYSGYFECVDLANGIVIGWEETLLDNPSCQR